jgi:cell division septal protein FtsQ
MSFFSSPTSNRRIKNGRDKRAANLLEVSMRPNRENRLQIRRRFSAFLKVTLVVGAIAGVAFGGRGMVNRLVWENPTYALADIRVATDGLLTRVQVLELLEVWEGKNIFTVDVAKMRRELDALPQVEKVEIRRHLPDRLEIRISERQPVAWVAASATAELGVGVDSLLVDTRGYVMRTRKVLPEHLALPRIIGVVMEDVAPGQKLPTAEALSALELIKLSVEDLRWQPRVVDVSKGYCLVVTDDRKARVTFGFDNIEGQLGRLRQLLDYVEPQNRELQSVNLMLERNIPVVFAQPPVPPTLPVIDPKTGKPKPVPKGAQTRLLTLRAKRCFRWCCPPFRGVHSESGNLVACCGSLAELAPRSRRFHRKKHPCSDFNPRGDALSRSGVTNRRTRLRKRCSPNRIVS